MLRAAAVASALGATLAAADQPATIALRVEASPFVAFNLWVRTGSVADPRGKEGLASLTGAMLANGATRHDAVDAILAKLYPMAATYQVSVDKEMTNLTGRVHRDKLEPYYALLRNALLAPAFPDADFARIKAQRLNALERSRRYARDEELSKQLLFWRAFAGTPYQHPEEGYVSSVRAITLDDVRGFYRQHYTRSSITVGIAGAVPAGFAERVRRDVDALPDSEPTPVTIPAVSPPQGIKILLVDKSTDASAISLGFPIALRRSDPDFTALLVANSYFGEHRESVGRLYQRIRDVRGMNYGNYSYIEAFPAGYASQQPRVNVPRTRQLFEIWIRPVSLTAPGNLHDRTLFATRAALFELGKLVNDGMTADAVATAKQYLRNYIGTWATTVSRRLAYAVDDAFYDMPAPGYLQALRPAIDRLTPADVNGAIRRHLHTGDYHLVIITADAARLKQKLLAGEPSPITYAGERPAELLEEDRQIASLPIPVKDADITILAIDQVFE
jgi:zinc protease